MKIEKIVVVSGLWAPLGTPLGKPIYATYTPDFKFSLFGGKRAKHEN